MKINDFCKDFKDSYPENVSEIYQFMKIRINGFWDANKHFRDWYVMS